MLKRILLVAVLGLFCACAMIAPAQAKRVLDEKLDMKTLEKMASSGQLIHISYKGGKIQDRMVCTLINAPLDKVWGALVEFKNWHKFSPSMLKPKVKKKSDTEFVVDFTLDIVIYGPIKTKQKYSTRYNLAKPYLYVSDPSKSKPSTKKSDYWKLVSVSGGKRTLLFYLDKAPDLKELGSFVYNMVKDKQELVLALQISPVSIQVYEFKKYVEKKKK